MAYTDAKIFYLVMKNFILIFVFIFVLSAGIVSGIAYERYFHREECLKLAFDNSGVENLSESEINEILKELNSNNSNDTPPSANAEYSSQEEIGPSPLSRGVSECNEGGVCYTGSKNSNKFYSADCRYAKLIKEENKVFFSSREEGEKAGRIYVECR